jgi:hypothetical protein
MEMTLAQLYTLLRQKVLGHLKSASKRDQKSFILHDLEFHGIPLSRDRTRVHLILPFLRTNHPRFVLKTSMIPGASAATKDPLTLVVKHVEGSMRKLRISSSSSVQELKSRIEGLHHVPIEAQRLVFSGKQLIDHETLKHYTIQSGDVVYMTKTLSGGGCVRVFADVSNQSLLKAESFSMKAPAWRECDRGLNLEGICSNSSCSAYKQLVIVPFREHPFNLYEHTLKCPLCQHKVVALTCGFYNCEWKFEGTKDLLHLSSSWQRVSCEKYHRFDILALDTSQKLVPWRSLLIHAKIIQAKVQVPFAKCVCCEICHEPTQVVNNSTQRFPKCAHTFHDSCLLAWRGFCGRIGRLSNCPTCLDTI